MPYTHIISKTKTQLSKRRRPSLALILTKRYFIPCTLRMPTYIHAWPMNPRPCLSRLQNSEVQKEKTPRSSLSARCLPALCDDDPRMLPAPQKPQKPSPKAVPKVAKRTVSLQQPSSSSLESFPQSTAPPSSLRFRLPPPLPASSFSLLRSRMPFLLCTQFVMSPSSSLLGTLIST